MVFFPLIFLDNPCGLSSSSYCSNGGTCVSSNTDPPVALCLCRAGFAGPYCNMTIQTDPCASNPCQANGYCALSASNTSYSCICQSNYIGNQCEKSEIKVFFYIIKMMFFR